MPTYPHIDSYYEHLRELIEFGGATNEENIRPAFQNCLVAYCGEHSERFVLVPELRSDRSNKPDGTIRDSLRMTRGLWEAKDTHDDLDREIRNKLGQGYSGDNILFENSRTAVLVQGDQEVLRTDMANAAALDELIRRFLNYELPEIQEFRDARQQFKTDLPDVLEKLRETIVDAEASNPSYQEGTRIFLELCHQSISPNVTNDNVREMLIQHILTKDIFLRVFGEDQFHRENNVARQLDALEGTFFTGNVRRQAIDRLRAYYGAIGRAADDIAEYSEKQQFLKGIYEDFYQAYNPGAADRLGVGLRLFRAVEQVWDLSLLHVVAQVGHQRLRQLVDLPRRWWAEDVLVGDEANQALDKVLGSEEDVHAVVLGAHLDVGVRLHVWEDQHRNNKNFAVQQTLGGGPDLHGGVPGYCQGVGDVLGPIGGDDLPLGALQPVLAALHLHAVDRLVLDHDVEVKLRDAARGLELVESPALTVGVGQLGVDRELGQAHGVLPAMRRECGLNKHFCFPLWVDCE